MALVEQSMDLSTRRGNGDQDWSRLCNNVFDQYLNPNEIFDVNNNDNGLSTNGQGNLLQDPSNNTSPDHSNDASMFWEPAGTEAKQPQPRKAASLWNKTLTTLEKNAAEDEARQMFPVGSKQDYAGANEMSQSVGNWSTVLEAPWAESDLSSMSRNRACPENLAIQHSSPQAFQLATGDLGHSEPGNMWTMPSGTWNNDAASLSSTIDDSSLSPSINTQAKNHYFQYQNLAGSGAQSRTLMPRSVPIDNMGPACHDYQHSLTLQRSPLPDFTFCKSPTSQSWSPSAMSGSSMVGTPLETYGLDNDGSSLFMDKPGSTDSLGISYNSPWQSQAGTPQYSSPYLRPQRTLAPTLTRSSSNRSSARGPSRFTQRSCSSSTRPRRVKSNISQRIASNKSQRSRERSPSGSATSSSKAAAGEGGFVNFTPQDGREILGGVAPSGSSKTKARREREAAEKRRRLNQAAVRAVVEAGGDLSALSQAGIMV